MIAIGDLVSSMTGLSLDEFAASHWGVAPLLYRAAQRPHAPTNLLTLAAVDELLSRRGLRTPFVRLSRDGEILSAARYTRSGGAGAEIADQVADDKVLAEFGAGATLVLQGLHRMWPPIAKFTTEFAALLGHPVQVNAYVTPPRNTGFAPHYDVHDVFVVQFAGRKHWRIHEPIVEAPLRDQPWDRFKDRVAKRAAEVPLIDCVLEPGDVLYLPRGYVHGATSLGDVSGHLTIGIHPVTRRALVDEMVSSFGDVVALRRSLPLGVDLADPSVLDEEIDATVASMHAAIDRIDRSAIARAIGRRLAAATRPEAINPIEQLAFASNLVPETFVRLRAGLRFTIRVLGDDVFVELGEKSVRFSADVEAAVRLAMSGDAVCAATLPEIDPGAGRALLSQLLREGLVVPA